MPQLVDNLQGDLAMFLIIIKGHYIGFYEYHNYRGVLGEDGVESYMGAIPFNRAPDHSKDNKPVRPYYKGVGRLKLSLEEDPEEDPLASEVSGIYLDLLEDAVDVEKVLEWMRDNSPLDVEKVLVWIQLPSLRM